MAGAAQVVDIQDFTTKCNLVKLFSCVYGKTEVLWYYESERDKDKKTNSFHEGSSSQRQIQVQQKIKTQKEL